MKTALKAATKTMMPRKIRDAMHPRSLGAICLGTPKSGTTSLANLFSQNFRYEHEAERDRHVKIMSNHYQHHRPSDLQYIKYLRRRNKRLWLDVESNCFLGYRPDLTLKAFPDYKYILTVRHPMPWLNSIFDNNLNYKARPGNTMSRWHNIFFKPERFDYTKWDKPLKEAGLYSLDAYLNYWSRFNGDILQTIPQSQLLVLDTKSISHRLNDISGFLDIKQSLLSEKNSHKNMTTKQHRIIEQLDTSYIEDRINIICSNIIEQSGLPVIPPNTAAVINK